MGYLIFLLLSIALLGGFLVLTGYETRRGARVLDVTRARLDRETERAFFIVEHVDLVAYVREETQHFLERFGHDIAHLFLQAVRAAERLLTHLVRTLRTRSESAAPHETQREFVKTLADFKDHLEATRPEVPDVNHVVE